MDYSESLCWLYNAAPAFHEVGVGAYKPGLERMLRLLEMLGNPHVGLRAVHVGGTNGKGSTSHLIASALVATGKRVGLYTSPHLVRYTERIRVLEQSVVHEVDEQWVAAFVTRHQDMIAQISPSFFEITTAMAFCYFKEQNVDVAVVEVGLGGLLDATNVLTPMVSVITNIGYDHTELLGSTLGAIAEQKAGIIKAGVVCVIGESEPETEAVFAEHANAKDAPIVYADQCEYLRRERHRYVPLCDLEGAYQEANMQTAYVALRALAACGTPIVVRRVAIAEGFAHVMQYTGLSGRWQRLSSAPLVVCDTGHNSHGIRTYIRQLQSYHRHLRMVFGMVADKDIDAVLALLPSADADYYFAAPQTKRAYSAEAMCDTWRRLHPTSKAAAYATVAEAVHAAMAEMDTEKDMLFIGGSNYLVGEVLAMGTSIFVEKICH